MPHRTTIREINGITAAIAAAVEEQVSAPQEIARNLQRRPEGAQEISGNIVAVTQAASETADAASKLTKRSERLKQEAASIMSEARAA